MNIPFLWVNTHTNISTRYGSSHMSSLGNSVCTQVTRCFFLDPKLAAEKPPANTKGIVMSGAQMLERLSKTLGACQT